jgi:hypothetical protein
MCFWMYFIQKDTYQFYNIPRKKFKDWMKLWRSNQTIPKWVILQNWSVIFKYYFILIIYIFYYIYTNHLLDQK